MLPWKEVFESFEQDIGQVSRRFQRYRGYYMPARAYEFYLRVVNSISHELAQRTSEISS